MTSDQADEIISLLKEQNKRLNALQKIEADNNMTLDAISSGGFGDVSVDNGVDKWGNSDNDL